MASPSLRDRLHDAPRLAFGISGALASPLVSQRRVSQLVAAARDHGVRIFDTSPVYGGGAGEARLGRAARDSDDFIMTKAGLTSSGLNRRHRDFTPDAVFASVQASILRLDRRPIDLLWLHGPAAPELDTVLIDRLEELREAGDVRHFGIAGRGEELRCAAEHDIFEAIMAPVNAGLPDPDIARLAELKAAGSLLFGIECLAQVDVGGVVSGRGGLWRGLRQLGGQRRHAPAQSISAEKALNWALDEGQADIVVTTTTSRQRLADNLAVMDKRARH